MAGLYIHIPFCVKKCAYCDFYSVENGKLYFEDYVNALIRDISSSVLKDVKTVFIGGGTPTALPKELLEKLFSVLAKKVSPEEFTVEVNPGTADEDKMRIFKDTGVTRLSIGLQAWQDRLLKIIGRIHSRKDFTDAVALADKFGFDINADAMFNLPSQTEDEWTETLSGIVSLGIKHVSCYSLTIAENTPFAEKIPFPLPDESSERRMYKKAVGFLKAHGMERYEISNFAVSGHECLHNLCYWKMDDYFAFGAGAHGCVGGKRYFYPDSIKDYINGAGAVVDEVISERDFISEYCMLALRLSKGIKKSEFEEKFGYPPEYYFEKEINKNVRLGLLEICGDSLRLTEKGFDFANLVSEDFILES